MQAALFELCVGTDRDLASSTEPSEQSALARSLGPRGSIIEKRERLAYSGIFGAGLDSKRSLSGSGTHEIDRKNLPHTLSPSQPTKPRRRQNDCVVFARFQLA